MKTSTAVVITAVLSAILVGGGVYYYLSAKATEDKQDLQAQINDLSAKLVESNNQSQPVQASTPEPASILPTPSAEPAATFTKDTNGYHGTFTLTGYIQKELRPRYADDKTTKVNYAYFIFSKTNSTLLSSFVSGNQGNSYVTNNGIGLGCLDSNNNNIYITNLSGSNENVITGSALQTLLGSTSNNQVKLQASYRTSTHEGGAPACFSFFENFQVTQ